MTTDPKPCEHLDVRLHRPGGHDFSLESVTCADCDAVLWSATAASTLQAERDALTAENAKFKDALIRIQSLHHRMIYEGDPMDYTYVADMRECADRALHSKAAP